MSKDQATEKQGQVEAPREVAASNEDLLEGLPPLLHAKVVAIPPGDAQALADLLKNIGEFFRPQVLAVAARTLGNAVVQRAIKLTEMRNRPDVAPGSQSRADMEEALHDASEPAKPAVHQPALVGEARDDMLRGLDGNKPTDPLAERPDLRKQVLALRSGDAVGLADILKLYHGTTVGSGILMVAREHLGPDTVARAVELKQHHVTGREKSQGTAMHQGGDFDPGTSGPVQHKGDHDAVWLDAARTYNAAHPEFVDEFNELTGHACRLDSDGRIDPEAVADWQARHGLPADGKIGPHTVAAARKAKATAPHASAASAMEARPPV